MKIANDPTTDLAVACLQRALAAHFDPQDGSPYWLERERELGLDARRDVRTTRDLAAFGPFDRAHLEERPLADFVPRSIWARRSELVLSETGGTTGRPVRTVFTADELHAAFAEPFLAAAGPRRFPRGGSWLFVGPSGPHVIGRAARLFARLSGALEPFSVDFDPRWARAQQPGSLGERLYREHVLDQALDVLAREPIEVLFTTPPMARALAAALGDSARATIRGVHLGGLAMEPAEDAAIRAAFASAVCLPGYGNSMFGVAFERRAPAADDPHLDYFARSGRLVARVCAEVDGSVDVAREVGPGEEGRVVLTRLDASFFLPNVVERDRATCLATDAELLAEGWAPTGLRDPRPAAAAGPAGTGDTERGLY